MEPSDEASRGIFWALRAGTAMCFIGHGALGISRVAAWTSYFAVVGIHRETALALMPFVGYFDVALGLFALICPLRGVVLYMAAWGLWTALLRPLSGESSWEAIERAGNYGAPLALALMAVPAAGGRLGFGRTAAEADGPWRELSWVLRATTCLLLLGHGMLGLVVRKPLLSLQYAHIGLHGAWVEPLIGAAECALAAAVFVRPGFGLLLLVVAWKLATEALSPIAGSPLWVFVEHGGSYAAPLALILALRRFPAGTRATRGSLSSSRSCSPIRS